MAGTIDQLNFEVILKDENFAKQIEKDIERAKELNTSLSKLLSLKKALDSDTTKSLVNAEKVAQAAAKTAEAKAKQALAEQKVRTEIEKTSAAAKSHADAVSLTNDRLYSTARILRTLSTLTGAAFSVHGLRRFLSSLIEITGQFEVQRMALRNMLQDVDGADKIFQDLYRFSSDSTYRFSELAKYAKQLAAFNIDKNNLLETTKMLGDVASGVGVSMDRLILAYGHVKSSGFLRGIQLRSFSQNGVPILEELSKMFTEIEGKAVSLGDVFDKMTKREIPFEMVEEAFRRMTSEGGKFYQMQEVLAKTLAGQINILKGRWENMLAVIGNANSGVLKDTVAWLSNLVSSTENVGRLLTEMAVAFGAYKVAVIVATMATKGFGTVVLDAGVALERFYMKLMNNPYAMIGVAVAAAGVAVYQYATALSDAEKITETATKGIAKYESALVAERAELDRLYAKLNLATEGTEEYNRAKNDIINRFGPYIQQLHEEGVAVDNLASIYDNLSVKVRDSLKARFHESESAALKKVLDDATSNIYESFKKTAESNGWSIKEQEDIWRYIVTGELKDKSLERELKKIGGGTIGMPGTFLYRDMGQSPEALRSLMEASLGAFDESMNEIDDALKTETEEVNNAAKDVDKDEKGWRGAVKKAIEGMSADVLKKTGLEAKEGEDYYEYIERIGKTSQELTKERDLALKSEKQEKENLLSAIKSVDKALEGNILKDARYTKTPWNGSGSSKDPSKDAISNIKAQISLLEKFRTAYDRLEPVMGADAARAWVFNNMGHDVEKLDGEFESLIATLREFGQEGNEAADSVEARFGLDAASKAAKAAQSADKAQKSLEKYQRTLRKWMGEDFNLGGSGFEYDIRKVFSDLNTSLAAVDEKYLQAVKEAEEAHKGNAEAIKDETEKLGALRDAEKDYERAQAQNRLDKLAESYLKDQYLLRGIDMDNIGDMSMSQLRNLRHEMEGIAREAVMMIAEMSGIEGYLASLGIDVENLTEEDLASLNDKLPETTIETIRLWKSLKDAGLSFETLTEKIQTAIKKGLKNLTDKELKALARFAKYTAGQVSQLADSFRELGEATGNGGLVSAADAISSMADVARGVSEGFRQGGPIGAVIGAITSIGKVALEKITENQREAARIAQAVRDAAVAYEDAADALSLASRETIFGVDSMGKLREYVRIMEKYKKVVSDFYDVFRGDGGLGDAFVSAYTDENGNMDLDKLKYDIENGLVVGGGVEDLLPAIEKYKDAMKEVDGIVESIFGDIASSAADKIVDSWIQAGDAALDYADILDDVARAYSKMLIQSMIMETALDPITEDLKKAFNENRYEDAMAMVANAMQTIEASAPIYEQILQAFDPYFNRSDSTGGGLGSGIKGITEQTANLLASYINAIRSDVSSIRLLQERGWAAVGIIGTNFPTLTDYMNQVAANTYDAAQNTNRILSELQSVIGPAGTSGSVVRVEAYR